MATRIERLRAKFDQLKIDAFLVTDGFNLQYLTGWAGLAGDAVVLVTKQSAYLITDSRYETAFKGRLPEFQLKITRDYLGVAQQIIAEQQIDVVGFETSLSYTGWSFLDEHFTSDIVPLTNVIEQLRAVKTPGELTHLQQAAALTDEGFAYITAMMHPGMTELAVSNLLDAYMRNHGASEWSFETIVASGYRSALPHGGATDKVLADGELVTIDFGYYVDGYTSDVTRTVALGQVSTELQHIYQIVATANAKIEAAVKPGVSGAELDRIGRSYITEAGYGPQFNHGTGHGIGLNIHELPNVGARFADVMQANEVITVEPGIYLAGQGGVRIEDDVLITESGHQVLTQAAKDLLVL